MYCIAVPITFVSSKVALKTPFLWISSVYHKYLDITDIINNAWAILIYLIGGGYGGTISGYIANLVGGGG